MFHVRIEPDVESWREAARSLLNADVEPSNVLWNDGLSGELLLTGGTCPAAPRQEPASGGGGRTPIAVPRDFLDVANLVAWHRDGERWGLLYRVLWRLVHGERGLLDICVDDDVHRLRAREKAVRRDRHKMTAF